ncbi:hypothetical protein BC829DRAFT_430187 [Chytridium lagenaria]|nr:hypothetical protein BC829DRAFT_430187 [Chytridium lagenaria]
MNKVVLVTGASRGLDWPYAGLSYLKDRMFLPQVESLISQYPKAFDYISLDITHPDAPDTVVNHTVSKFSKLDAVVFNAGVLDPVARMSDVDVNILRKLFDINLFSIISLAQRCLPYLRKAEPGRMILVSSGAATKAYPGWGLTASLIEEQSVVSVALRPGVVDTEMQNFIRNPGNESSMTPENHANFVKLFEDKKLLSPDVPGSVIARLALNASKDLNGVFISWDDPKLESL